uniref:Sulfotransferase domain-containing protein n=1 Tax=Timema douglasi TaxID=61478 RepID=A0A7R8VZY4_TIMDO|nr:unnamed protein product [Timema douglasi]
MVWLIGNDLDFEGAKQLQQIRTPLLELCAIMAHDHGEWMDELGNSVDLVESMPSPRYIKSHLPLELLPAQLDVVRPKLLLVVTYQPSSSLLQMVYVARNPKDMCVSYYHYCMLVHNLKGSFQDFCDLFLKDRGQSSTSVELEDTLADRHGTVRSVTSRTEVSPVPVLSLRTLADRPMGLLDVFLKDREVSPVPVLSLRTLLADRPMGLLDLFLKDRGQSSTSVELEDTLTDRPMGLLDLFPKDRGQSSTSVELEDTLADRPMGLLDVFLKDRGQSSTSVELEDTLADRHGTVRSVTSRTEDQEGAIRQTARFLGKTLSESDVKVLTEHLSFNKMKQNPAVNLEPIIAKKNGPDYLSSTSLRFIRKGEVGDWRNHMEPDMAARFDAWTEENLRGTGLSLD